MVMISTFVYCFFLRKPFCITLSLCEKDLISIDIFCSCANVYLLLSMPRLLMHRDGILSYREITSPVNCTKTTVMLIYRV